MTGASNQAVDWFVNDISGGTPTIGTISPDGLYTAPNLVPVPPTVTIKAVSQADGNKSDTASVTIVIQVEISAPPGTSLILGPGGAIDFEASVIGTTNTAVTWYVNQVPGGNSSIGTVTAEGIYTAPASVPRIQKVRVRAISQADNSVEAEILVTLSPQYEIFLLDQYGNVYSTGGTVVSPTP